jgi:hypothetical protein
MTITTNNSAIETMSLGTKGQPKPSPTAPYAVAVPVVQPGTSTLRTKTGNTYNTNNNNSNNNTNSHTTTSNNITNNNGGGRVNVEIEMQPNTDPGIVFGDNPLVVLRVDRPIPSLAQQGTTIEGYYFSALRLPGFEITNVVHEQQLTKLMASNRHLPRTLVVSSHPPLASLHGCHYKHDLPACDDLGIQFTGFPAKVLSVDPNSPMVGKIHPGQSVHAVIVPRLADLTMQSGGFTGSRVAEHLQTHGQAPNKQLVVMDQPILVRDKTSRNAIDCTCDCIVL